MDDKDEGFVVLAASFERGLDRAIKMAELLNDQLDDLLASANEKRTAISND